MRYDCNIWQLVKGFIPFLEFSFMPHQQHKTFVIVLVFDSIFQLAASTFADRIYTEERLQPLCFIIIIITIRMSLVKVLFHFSLFYVQKIVECCPCLVQGG